ncbi:DUF305 domain-containing protein [Limnothrix sp. FACHB-708]|uniref:DUF305 domain-containing protein n=1 Tax=unclassified Limnothrix TaxID=2632864 RepID=UPI001685FB1C|nr:MULTISPECIES: DUF305 domain-containing protein [unclassified Limnothrix]MBD2554027.1 DUF305 domain-containing protein [Limnothrix sp. FACHB-708]MBD2591742.1 DUF305 domain-containing protein [Limnothrix sp. FACHB-406]
MKWTGKQGPWLAGLSLAIASTAAIGSWGFSQWRAQQPAATAPGSTTTAQASPALCPPGGDAAGGMAHHMHSMQVSSEFEFISHMIPHHQEAIDTAKLVRDRTQRPEMRQFTQAIIDAQSREVSQMKTWLQTWYPNQTSTQAYQPMMRPLEPLQGDALDQQFLQDMVMHHQGAVMMAQSLIQGQLVKHPPVQSMAQDVIRTQSQEIGQMQTWLGAWFPNGGQCGRSTAADSTGNGLMNHGNMNHGNMNHGNVNHGKQL